MGKPNGNAQGTRVCGIGGGSSASFARKDGGQRAGRQGTTRGSLASVLSAAGCPAQGPLLVTPRLAPCCSALSSLLLALLRLPDRCSADFHALTGNDHRKASSVRTQAFPCTQQNLLRARHVTRC